MARRPEILRKNKDRVLIAFFFFIILVFALIVRLAWIQIVDADELNEKAVNQQLSDIPVKAKRGEIYDSKGKQIATNIEGFEVWVRPQQIRDTYSGDKKMDIAAELAGLIDKKTAALEKVISTQISLWSGYQASWIRRPGIKILKLEISGLEFTNTTQRYYPMGTMAANLIGSVDSEGHGRSGLEAQFDQALSGVSEWLQDTPTSFEILFPMRNKQYVDARDGYNAVLTT